MTPMSALYHHLLLPVDGSRVSHAAALEGIALARALDARVTAIHVVPEPLAPGLDAWAHDETDFAGKLASLLESKGQAYLDRVREAAQAAGVSCECCIARGAVHAQILSRAAASDCDLIVMGSHGEPDGAERILGSDAVKVATAGSVPVLIHHGEPQRG